LTIAGGVFYVLGGAVVALLVGSLSSLGGGLGLGSDGVCSLMPGFPCTNTLPSLSGSGVSGSGLDLLGYAVAGFGIVAGILIIVGGIMFRSTMPSRRKMGGILAVVMILLGGLATLGGLVVGFFLAVIGAYLGLTYKANTRGMVIGLGPIGSVNLGSHPASSPTSNAPAGTGPLNYCIKCGSQIREGAVFCGACGARVVD
jgi:zinc-ribbon domain